MTDTWMEKMDDYLNGKMSREERSLFESEMAADPELSSAFRIYQVIETEMRTAEKYRSQDAALKETLANLKVSFLDTESVPDALPETGESGKHQPGILKPAEVHPALNRDRGPALEQEPGKVIRMNRGKRLAIAAGFIGIVLLGVIWYTQKTDNDHKVAVHTKETDGPETRPEGLQTAGIPDTSPRVITIPPESIARQNQERIPTPEKKKDKRTEKNREIKITGKEREALFAGNFQPDTTPVQKAGPLQEALAYYEAGEYENAAIAFEKVDLNRVARGDEGNKKRTAFYAHYYKGMSYLAGHKAARAIPELEKALSNSPDRFLSGKTKWYLALACLKTGQLKRAENLLIQLARSNGAYQLKSKSLIGKLNRQ